MKTLTFAIAAAFALLVAGCNTFEGLGKDIKGAGEKIEESSKKK